jgi:hypothetical protein
VTGQRRGWDWAGKHGTVDGTLAVCGWAFAAVVAADVLDMSRWWAAAAAAAGALATQLVSVRKGLARSTQFYRFCCWVGLGGWGWWAIGAGAWRPETVGALTVLALAGGLLATVYAHLEATEQARRLAVTEAQKRDALGRAWERRLEKAAHKKGCVVEGVEYWPDGRGYTLDVALPDDGTTWESFLPYAAGLAAAAKLLNGCGVEPSMGCDRAHMLLKVSTSNVMSDHVFVPDDTSRTSINDPVFLGWERDGAVAAADMRQARWVHGAAPGTGKTTQQHKVVSQVARTVDGLPWIIDMNSGALGVPWVLPWWEGRADRPAIDWLAGDADEAWLMTEAALAVMADRKVTSGETKRAANTTLMPISAELPAICTIGDEMSEFLGTMGPHAKVRENIGEGFRMGRDAGLLYALSVLRGTAEYIDTSLLGFCDVVVVMNPADDKEIADFLGWKTGMKADDAPYPGCAVARPGKGERVRPIKCPDMLPDQIDAFAVAVADRRPELDQAAQDAIARRFTKRDSAGNVINDGRWVYEQRWARAEKWIGKPAASQLVTAGAVTTAAEQGGAELPQKWPKPEGSVEDAFDAAAAAVDEARRVADEMKARRADLPDEVVNAEFQALASRFEDGGTPDPRARVWQLLEAAGDAGSTPTKLEQALQAEGYPTTRPTIHGWLKEWLAAGRLRQDGERQPYIVVVRGEGES